MSSATQHDTEHLKYYSFWKESLWFYGYANENNNSVLSQQVFYNGRLPAAFKCQFIIPVFGKHRQQVTILKEKCTSIMSFSQTNCLIKKVHKKNVTITVFFPRLHICALEK